MTKALLVVDVQNDFCEGGALAVKGGIKTATMIASFIEESRYDYDHIIASKDWHIEPGAHFSKNPDFIDTWPEHCRHESEGADFQENIDPDIFDAVFHKGQYDGAYSAFEGTLADSEEEEVIGESQTMDTWLNEKQVDELEIVGIATDYCVKETAIDAAHSGLNVLVDMDLTAAIHPETLQQAIDDMEAAGVVIEGEDYQALKH